MRAENGHHLRHPDICQLFNRAWDACQLRGRRPRPDGGEYRRLLWAWIAADYLTPVEPWLAAQMASQGPALPLS